MSEQTATDTEAGKHKNTGIVRILRQVLFATACLITLIAIFYAEEDWRGKHAWEKFKSEWEAKGEKFDLRDFVPPPVPDDQNFAMTPFLAPLFDLNPRPLQPSQSLYRDTNGYNRINEFGNDLKYPESFSIWVKSQPTDLPAWAVAMLGKSNAPAGGPASLTRTDAAAVLVKGLEKYRPVLDEIQSASQRPFSRFNVDYAAEPPAGILLPHLAVMKKMAQMFALRASAELALGRNDEAFADVKTVVYLSGTMKTEPFLISGLVRNAILQITILHLWEGLAAHQWSDAQLAEFETELGRIDLLAEYEIQLRGERALANGNIDYLRTHNRMIQDGDLFMTSSGSSFNPAYFIPDGWFYENKFVINRMYQEMLLSPEDAANHRVDVSKCSEIEGNMDQELFRGFPPYKFLARMMMPALDKAINKYAFAQVNLDLTSVACALERYRLANGHYPDTLAALSPKYIATVPNDVITGEPLKYRRTDDGQFLLYSVGWNGTDDGGKLVMGKGTTPQVDRNQGDWVWPAYPTK